MKLDELYKYFEKKKDDFVHSKKINFSKCYKNYFQISLFKNNKPYSLSGIHYEIMEDKKDDNFIFNIHFEEFDTTRYKKNKKLEELAEKNELEYFSWWTGKTKKNNQNNQSLKSKSIIIKTEEDADKFINYLNNIFEQFNDLLLEIEQDKGLMNMKTKNIMLYGAPGVGKTHNYKRLITMIENGESEKTIFDTISKNETTNNFDNSIFETIKNEKRIEFVTFHQSYSYEDFIEGFRPNENGDIELDKKGGVFKRIADKARENLEESQKEKIQVKEEITFRQKLDSFIEKLEIEIEKKGYYEITDAAYISSIDSDAFRYNIRKENPTYKYDLRMKFEDLFEFEKNKVSSRQDVKKLETINSLANQHATYYYKVFNEIISNSKDIKINDKEINNVEQKNFYIVIDEINRGNISKIFGELITLIEEDKRDNYEVTLPYSKEKFKIPSNLYIIATMNSTDKSIATIDIALRRRFTFLKMKPNIDLVPQNAKELFITLNEFIGKNLGEDYKLGHSYFMQNLDLEFVKEYKIKPLLEEYFYGDEENYNKALKILEENR
ncbi:ATPase [Aliarcobacter butzleri L355]|uniref:ATPase n=2 Tax=Aliarcobacter butzleri TaxID=28197 RepID=A0A0G9KPT9_9BACT|nr:AAA family ATPase [Aliarcobacter butzleri]KLE08496.1 ATPase [Aliarcobacter butzleri L355]